MTDTRTHALYRFHDANGALLYVGITMDPTARWRAHRHDKPWWHCVTQITIETHPTRDAVLAAERTAIQNEHPLHNVLHNQGTLDLLTEFDELALALVGDDRTTGAWGTQASDMPDCCQDCRRAGTAAFAVYEPHTWTNGLAEYTCDHGHHWTCGWGHPHTGTMPQRAVR